MLETRGIIHFDLDAFFCSVEVLQRPQWQGQPLVVGGSPEKRGVVASASYPARKYGIHSAMPMAQAVQLCPQLIIVPPHFKRYRTYSRIVMGILETAAAAFQQVSVDEAYLDVTSQLARWEEIVEIGRGLQTKIAQHVGLPASLGLATNKLVAKIASAYGKPKGFTLVTPGTERAFLAPLAIGKIPGIGPRTAARLKALGIPTIRQLQTCSLEQLKPFGRWGALMIKWARGEDTRPVREERVRKSLSQERTFPKDVVAQEVLFKHLKKLSDNVATRLQQKELLVRTVFIKVRYSDFTTLTRQKRLLRPTNSLETINRMARELLVKVWDGQRPLRLLGVGGRDFYSEGDQLSFAFLNAK
ncbi:MAG: DNA polymerase IV [Fidelibacterota bacterium]